MSTESTEAKTENPSQDASVACSQLLAAFPSHKAGLRLEHNQHRNYYEKAADWIAENEWCDWESEEAKQKAIKTDEIWTLQWSPETPIGFCGVAAPTLEDLLRIAGTGS